MKRKLPFTSRLAYDSITQDHKRSMWAKIVRELKKAKTGLTADQIALKLNVTHEQVSRRMAELEDSGVIYTLKKVTRPTRTGRPAQVRCLAKKYAA